MFPRPSAGSVGVAVLCLGACSVQLDRFSGRDARQGDGPLSLMDAAVVEVGAVDTGAADAPPPGSWVRISAGAFTMGSAASEPCRNDDEDLHPVTLTRAFLITSSEVTRQQFDEVLGYDPSEPETCADCPVNNVSWHEAAAYCNTISTRAGLEPCYHCNGDGASVTCSLSGATPYDCGGYRLPTEAEWEYAYRAGTKTAFYNGPITGCTGADAGLDPIAWYKTNAGSALHPVATRQPNDWGLHDLAGNALEWVNDRYAEHLGTAEAIDPVGPATGTERVQRGGSYDFGPGWARAAARMTGGPDLAFGDFGFRPARTAPVDE